MVKVTYVKTRFTKPFSITEREYYRLKDLLTKTPDSKITPGQESFLNHFRSKLILIGVGIVCFFGSSIFPDSWLEVMFAFVGLALMVSFVINIFLEISSYLEYLSDKKSYYKKMKEAIIRSKDYKEFVKFFYGIE